MYAKISLIVRISQTIGGILLATLVLNACNPKLTTIPTDVPSMQTLPSSTTIPTSVPSTQALPSPTTIPSTVNLDIPGLVTSMDEILGEWVSSGCGGGPCVFEFRADGTYKNRYVTPTEGQGITMIDRGKITFSDGVFHLESTYGYCQIMNTPHGYYQAFLTEVDGSPVLEFKSTEKNDECGDRKRAISNGLKPFTK